MKELQCIMIRHYSVLFYSICFYSKAICKIKTKFVLRRVHYFYFFYCLYSSIFLVVHFSVSPIQAIHSHTQFYFTHIFHFLFFAISTFISTRLPYPSFQPSAVPTGGQTPLVFLLFSLRQSHWVVPKEHRFLE